MGGLAAYAQPGQHWEFIEIDPDVAAIAADTRYFHFLADARTPIRVVLDDGRLALSRAQPGRYALIVMDAFSSDSVPVHLITTDALAVYRRALRPDGLLLINVRTAISIWHPSPAPWAWRPGSMAAHDFTT